MLASYIVFPARNYCVEKVTFVIVNLKILEYIDFSQVVLMLHTAVSVKQFLTQKLTAVLDDTFS